MFENVLSYTQWEKWQKTVWKSVFFVNLVLKLQCHIAKNTLLRTAFSAILPTWQVHYVVLIIDIGK